MNTEIVNTRTGIGAGIGALVGFVFAGPVGAGVGLLVGGGIARASGGPDKGVLTPKRTVIYKGAMESIKDPAELEKLADAFAGEGLIGEAAMLRKRAALRKLPKDTRDKRRAAFRKAMACDKEEVILKVALAFENEGAIDAAKGLKDHADAVRAAHAAGRSAKPMTGGSQSEFAEKLAKSIIHFGPDSAQAKGAAGNLIRARGKAVSEALVAEVISIAAEALKVEAPQAAGPPEAPIEIAETPEAPEEGEAPEAPEPSEEEPSAPTDEPIAIEPPGEAKIEPQVISEEGVVVTSGVAPPRLDPQVHPEVPAPAAEEAGA